jgi:hypothetical protein
MAKHTPEIHKVKTLEDIKMDMSVLYNGVRDGNTELKMAAELSNIAGKYLKAEQLDLARQIFLNALAPEKLRVRFSAVGDK